MEEIKKNIVNFLGWEMLPYNKKEIMVITNNKETYNLKSIKFYSDWNLLMKVVEKIESLDKIEDNIYNVIISNTICKIETSNSEIVWIRKKSKIEAVHEAVVKFINFYNKQKEE